MIIDTKNINRVIIDYEKYGQTTTLERGRKHIYDMKMLKSLENYIINLKKGVVTMEMM